MRGGGALVTSTTVPLIWLRALMRMAVLTEWRQPRGSPRTCWLWVRIGSRTPSQKTARACGARVFDPSAFSAERNRRGSLLLCVRRASTWRQAPAVAPASSAAALGRLFRRGVEHRILEPVGQIAGAAASRPRVQAGPRIRAAGRAFDPDMKVIVVAPPWPTLESQLRSPLASRHSALLMRPLTKNPLHGRSCAASRMTAR